MFRRTFRFFECFRELFCVSLLLRFCLGLCSCLRFGLFFRFCLGLGFGRGYFPSCLELSLFGSLGVSFFHFVNFGCDVIVDDARLLSFCCLCLKLFELELVQPLFPGHVFLRHASLPDRTPSAFCFGSI